MLDDYKSAPIDEAQRALFALLEKLSLTPDAVTTEDTLAPEQLGLSRQAVQDAVHVCILFNIIVRIADALNFDIPPDAAFEKMAKISLKKGYKL